MNGTTEVPQEYDQRDMFFFVRAGLVPEKTYLLASFAVQYITPDWLKLMNSHGFRRLIGRAA